MVADVAARVADELRRYGAPEATIDLVSESTVLDGAVGVVLYGSYGRGDFSDASDVDLLVVADRPRGSTQVGVASVSVYTADQLAGVSGTLFGMHLARDGKVLHDVGGSVSALLDSMTDPDPALMFGRIRHLGAVLDGDPSNHLGGRTKVVRYLLRTAVYVAALAAGEPCFSVSELARRAGEPELEQLLASRFDLTYVPSVEEFADLLGRLIGVVGPLDGNPHSDLRNLVVAEWWEDRDLATLGVLALSGSAEALDYTALAKVIL